MHLKKFFSFLIVIIIISFLIIFYFLPFRNIRFEPVNRNTNFSLNNSLDMQFYPNMRYPSPNISYKIDSKCPLDKKNHIEWAFEILENRTLLNFYPVKNKEEITITCDNKNRLINKSFFIAGEGGVVKVVKSGNFNIILNGMVLLIRKSKCERPLVSLHELLHALGFKHSKNKNNVMFPYSNCNQVLGKDIPYLINNLYSIKSEPDLEIKNVSSFIHNRFLNTNLSIYNVGLKKSNESSVKIFADDSLVKEINVSSLEPGQGVEFILKNYWVKPIKLKELKFIIIYNSSEINKKNNLLILKKIN